MLDLQNYKFAFGLVETISASGTDNLDAEIDTLGYNSLCIVLTIGTTDCAISDFQVTASDTSGSGYTDISGATFSSLPTATDDNEVWAIFIDLRNQKRYVQVDIGLGTGTNGEVAVIGLLGDADDAPTSASERGLGGEAFVLN